MPAASESERDAGAQAASEVPESQATIGIREPRATTEAREPQATREATAAPQPEAAPGRVIGWLPIVFAILLVAMSAYAALDWLIQAPALSGAGAR